MCEAVLQLLQCPEDFDDQDEEEQEDFRRLRNDVADVLQDCCDVVGGDKCLERFFAALQVAARDVNDWQSIEACFYAIRRIYRQVGVQENRVLPQLLPMLPQLPKHPQLDYTATLVVGAYAGWVNANPAIMGDLFTYVLSRLGDPKALQLGLGSGLG